LIDLAARADVMAALTMIALKASRAIRDHASDRDVHIKADGSPVTEADVAADRLIRDALGVLAPDLPVISEEQTEGVAPVPAGADYFLVDPLDGTREFIAGRDEYTVNIALMSGRTPLAGVIAAPALGILWRGTAGQGAERLPFSGLQVHASQPIHARRRAGACVVMVSRSHLDRETESYVARLGAVTRLSSGSSIKFCRLAEGVADIYPRLAPTRDWDVAAGHAILAAAGGKVATPGGNPLAYGTPALTIPAFIAFGDTGASTGALTD
jgi:3'(2'), 5'-bisphosphate nucleotidase